ncbi:hypothetical protein [Streptomyces sp. NPDC090022]|uniref:effector-associated constant component EACC1 n=1 Tax=Streptomyces sp. NPDC090022 TaxID=3365920 RepID=UPI0038246B24
MRITIARSQSAPLETERELRSLHQWLRDDDRVRRHAHVEWGAAAPAPGTMGSAPEYVLLAVESGVQLAGLALAWFTWRGTRPRPPAVTFEHEGVTVTLDGQDPETAARLLEALTGDARRAAQDDPASPPASPPTSAPPSAPPSAPTAADGDAGA